MFNRLHLQTLMDLRRMTAYQLAKRAHISRGALSRVLQGKRKLSFEYALRVAAALGVSANELDDSPILPWRHWQHFTWKDIGSVREHYEELRATTSLITCTQGLPAYLQKFEIRKWAFERAHLAAGWPQPELDAALATVITSGNGDLKAHQDSGTIHRVIAREWWFRQAFECADDWMTSFRSTLRILSGQTLLGVVPDASWRDVSAMVSEAMVEVYCPLTQWDLVTVGMIGNRPVVAMIRPSRDEFLVSHHFPTVERLKWTLENVARHSLLHYEQLPLGQMCLAERKNAVENTVTHLERLAVLHPRWKKEKPPQHEAAGNAALWAQLALRPEIRFGHAGEQLVRSVAISGKSLA